MNAIAKLFLSIGSISGALAVLLGAFGAHGLKEKLSAEVMAVYKTAVEYQFYHTLALLIVGVLALNTQSKPLTASGWLFTAGILIFSGSLYALSISGIKWLGAITPIGGLCFIVGWVLLAVAAFKS